MDRNLLFRLTYRGTRYHGFQMQQNALSVYAVLAGAAQEVLGSRHGIIGCSRTDAGVHAREYYCNVKTQSRIPADAFVRAMNAKLPGDIAVTHCREVPLDFHARFSAREKEYVYQIWNHPVKHPFYEDLALHYKYPLDLEQLRRAGEQFVGTHDFAAFCSAGAAVSTTVRTIYACQVEREGSMIRITVRGNGFLYNMVRILVGTMLEICEGRRRAEDVSWLYQTKNREGAGRTAPPQGLYLNRVFYDQDWFDLDEIPEERAGFDERL